MRKVMTLTLAALVAASTAAAAKPSLRDVPEIDDGLFIVAMANEIRRKCDSISPRWIRANSYVNALKRKAEDLGYSRAEMEAHLDSQVEKDRMRAIGENYMTSKGVAKDDFCSLGSMEIAAGSPIGRLLREH